MLRNVLFVRKFVEKAHESSFPLGNEIQVAQPVHGGPRGTKWGLHNLYFDWASSSRATDNGDISLCMLNWFQNLIQFKIDQFQILQFTIKQQIVVNTLLTAVHMPSHAIRELFQNKCDPGFALL